MDFRRIEEEADAKWKAEAANREAAAARLKKEEVVVANIAKIMEFAEQQSGLLREAGFSFDMSEAHQVCFSCSKLPTTYHVIISPSRFEELSSTFDFRVTHLTTTREQKARRIDDRDREWWCVGSARNMELPAGWESAYRFILGRKHIDSQPFDDEQACRRVKDRLFPHKSKRRGLFGPKRTVFVALKDARAYELAQTWHRNVTELVRRSPSFG